MLRGFCAPAQGRDFERRTFSSTAEFDHDFLVHVLVQVQDVLFLWPFLLLLLARVTASSSSASSTTSSASSSSTAAAAAELTSLRHLE